MAPDWLQRPFGVCFSHFCFLFLSIFQCHNPSSSPSEKTTRLYLRIKTVEDNGMLIWTSQGPSVRGDYLTLVITDGFPELSFNLGKSKRNTRVSAKVIIYVLSSCKKK